MLDTIRMFAGDQLERTGERDAAADRFISWAVDLASCLGRQAATEAEPRADAVVRRELANLRAAWLSVRQERRFDDAVRLIVPLADLAGWRDLTEIWSWSIELATASALSVEAARDGLPTEPNLGIAALATAYAGDLEAARVLQEQMVAATVSPTTRGSRIRHCRARPACSTSGRSDARRGPPCCESAGSAPPTRRHPCCPAGYASAR